MPTPNTDILAFRRSWIQVLRSQKKADPSVPLNPPTKSNPDLFSILFYSGFFSSGAETSPLPIPAFDLISLTK
jgi:hypothetical protein